jgi:hypothetical protein
MKKAEICQKKGKIGQDSKTGNRVETDKMHEKGNMIRKGSIFACALALIAVWLVGCARVTVTPVTKEDRTTPGVRYYESEPYLLVTNDVSKEKKEKGATTTPIYTIQLVWLPNYNMGYAVKTTPGLGTADGKVKLADGWRLTDFGAIVDTKIPETISAVADLVKALGVSALTKGTPPETVVLEPGLYRLNFNKEKGHFEGLERVF